MLGDEKTGIAAAEHAASIDPTIESFLDEWEIDSYDDDITEDNPFMIAG